MPRKKERPQARTNQPIKMMKATRINNILGPMLSLEDWKMLLYLHGLVMGMFSSMKNDHIIRPLWSMYPLNGCQSLGPRRMVIKGNI